MAPPIPPVAIERLRSAWDAEVRPSARRALVALPVLAFFGGAHVARLGTPVGRAGAVGVFVLSLLVVVARWAWLRRRRSDPRRVVSDTVVQIDPDLGAATLRAMTLAEQTAAEARPGSASLASLHLERLLARPSAERLARRAGQSGARWAIFGLACGLAASAAVMVEPLRVVEGLDVLGAEDGTAPLRLPWIAHPSMAVAAPEYLHQPPSEVLPFSATAAPKGSVITVRGRPLQAGRDVVLTDGRTDVPFTPDGLGNLVARWTVTDAAKLSIAVRFGEVRVYQPDDHQVVSIADQVPLVKVEGAPRTVKLIEEPRVTLRYEATDDHGLREVQLVLRSGTREDRRILAHPAADVLVDRGGYDLAFNDAFLKNTYAPVEVTVEARDNDTVSGPKWGKSAPILVVPPQVGEAEALRFKAFVRGRDALVDLLATRLRDKSSIGADHAKAEGEAQRAASAIVNEVLSGSYGGLDARGRIARLIRGQLRRLDTALDAEVKAPSQSTHQKLVDQTEEVVLGVDSGVRALGVKDSRTVAKRLAEVAEEAAGAFATIRGASGAVELAPGAGSMDRAAGEARTKAALEVLDGGGKNLLDLGELGLDLGEIVQNDLRRIRRAEAAKDYLHAELAARDLAARLRKPDPSFSGGGGGSGVESGSGKGGGGDSGDKASEADSESAADEHELEEIIRDHENKIGDVENALEKAISQQELEQLQKEAKEHADAIREAVKRLPPPRAREGSAEAAAAAAREEAEAMAGALEGGRPKDALQSGKRALEKMGEAQRLGEQNKMFPREAASGNEAGASKPTLEREMAWAEDAMEKLRRSAANRAKGDLGDSSKDEGKLADRSRNLGKKAEAGDGSLPQESLERLNEAERTMRDAQRALKEGDGENGLRLQKSAQRLLEMARGEREPSNDGEGKPKDGKMPSGKAEIPDKDKHRGPEDFRRRVMKGLGGSTDPLLRDAVRRYAEGLLK